MQTQKRVPLNNTGLHWPLGASVSPNIKWEQWYMPHRLVGILNESPFVAHEAALAHSEYSECRESIAVITTQCPCSLLSLKAHSILTV